MFKTRIAPSPTGFMHLGTARTAIFCYLVAKSTNGNFVLRIDDTDVERNNPETEQPILDGLTWLGLDWDEFYRQSERTDIYAKYAKDVLDAGYATEADNGAIILKWHPDTTRTWVDEVGGEMKITDQMIEQIDNRLVLTRGGEKKGQVTYQFASILDDYLMDINYIIRGTDHIANTSKQIAIWHVLNLVVGAKVLPKFAHVGLIFKDKKKMSKRDGAASLLDYRDSGVDPDGMFNFLLRLGWGPKQDDKNSTFMSKDQAKALFLEGGNMRSANAGFDQMKLDFYDRRYKQMKYKENLEVSNTNVK